MACPLYFTGMAAGRRYTFTSGHARMKDPTESLAPTIFRCILHSGMKHTLDDRIFPLHVLQQKACAAPETLGPGLDV